VKAGQIKISTINHTTQVTSQYLICHKAES